MTSALMRFYRATNRDGWANSKGWGEGEPCRDAWHGVYCCPTSHPVLSMDFSSDYPATHDPTKDRCLNAYQEEGRSPLALREDAGNDCGMEDTCVVVALCVPTPSPSK